MRKNVYCSLLLTFIFILSSNLEAKSCADVKSEFTKKITEMKESWDKEEKNLDNMIETLDTQIVNLEKAEASTLVKTNDKYESDRSKELDKVRKIYETTLMKLENEEKADQEKMNKANTDNESSRASLVKLKEKTEKDLAAFEPLKQEMFAKHEKEKEKIESDNEIQRMKDEDEDRKFQTKVAEDYQKEFDSLNKELEAWDKNEEGVKAAVSAVDKEIEQYAIEKAAEMEKKQSEIEKKRAEVQKIYDAKKGDPSAEAEYITENEKLDTQLSKENSFLNAQVKQFRAKKLTEKKEKEKAYTTFLKNKKVAKITVDMKVKKAQEKRDKEIAARKALRNIRDTKWKQEMLMKETLFKKSLDDKYTKPRDIMQKQLDAFNNKIADMDDKIMSEKIKANNEFNTKKEKREKAKEVAETVYNNESDKIKTKYDNLILASKQKSEKTKQDLTAKRDALLKKKDDNKIRNQATLDKEKEKYQKAMSGCKN